MIANRWQKHYHLLVFRGLMKRYVTSWVCCFKMFLSKKTGGWCSHYSLSPAANQVHANFESCGSCSSNIPFQKKNSSLNWAPYSFLRFPSILPRIQGCCFLKYFFCFEPIDEKKWFCCCKVTGVKEALRGETLHHSRTFCIRKNSMSDGPPCFFVTFSLFSEHFSNKMFKQARYTLEN